VLYWKYLPIKDNPSKMVEYIATLDKCLEAINTKFGKNSSDPEAVFYTMVARGYMAMLYNYKGEMLNAAGEGKKAYNSFLVGLKLIGKNPEFYFTSGMYNYYVVAYPEVHTMTKPLMIFFKKGDKALGLKQIDTGTKSGIITKAESCYHISRIYIKYENLPEKAIYYSQKLVDWYPQNPIYRMTNIEAQLLSGHYDQAKSSLKILQTYKKGFFPVATHTFQAIIQEKEEHNDSGAQKDYLLALQNKADDQYTKEYHAMSYAGLARIAHRAGDTSKARSYYKKCLELAEYGRLKAEAKAYK
jgi:tetratricopeptide (TPR) repeat protein